MTFFLRRQLIAGVLLCGLVLPAGCLGPQRYYIAPTLTPGTQPEMNTAGYWIGRHPDPDRLLMTADEIDSFNAHIRNDLKTVADISRYPAVISGPSLRRELRGTLDDMARQEFWRGDGRVTDEAFFAAVARNLNLDAIPETVATRFALVTDYADQRVLPTAEILCSEPGDINFDELQNSAYDIGTPVAVVHTSADRQWVYAVAPLSNGWMPAAKVAYCTRRVADYLAHPPVVVTQAKADIYTDSALRNYHGRVRLGAVLGYKPSLRELPVLTFASLAEGEPPAGTVRVYVPTRCPDGNLLLSTMYVRAADVSRGYLPLTPRSLIQTAFTMLNTPYGWGDMYGEQDCSRFIQQVFAAHGVMFPRNSTAQGLVGTALPLTRETPDAEKDAILARDGIGGATVLELNGHIMLYIGSSDGRPYVIHDIWGYREPSPFGDVVNAINRVAVTNLEIGRGSRRGALISRLRSARIIE